MIDRTTKLLLLVIAIGLWMNVAAQWLQPIPVQAASEEIEQVFSRSIQFEQYSYRQLARDRTFRRQSNVLSETVGLAAVTLRVVTFTVVESAVRSSIT
uniref:Uncharacterized protein n=1 Tax=uncultured gamma proteobacterium HF4000_48E10 TaxID=723583 RepID=E7C8Q7_9GAMM|nr:hypothetical protein [uncultured gamma proteobacterium HF4000_48E10]